MVKIIWCREELLTPRAPLEIVDRKQRTTTAIPAPRKRHKAIYLFIYLFIVEHLEFPEAIFLDTSYGTYINKIMTFYYKIIVYCAITAVTQMR